MVCYQITEIKNFMKLLLATEVFDDFLLSEAVVQTMASFSIDGHRNLDYYTQAEQEESGFSEGGCIRYGEVRKLLFEVIRGKKTPVAFQMVFLLPPERFPALLEQADTGIREADIGSLSFTLRFKEGGLTLMTGVALRIFTMDRTLEEEWDRFVTDFLAKHKIHVDIM